MLLQSHCRGQTIDAIDLRNAHLVDESARIGRDRFEVSALRLGIQGAEGERRLADRKSTRLNSSHLVISYAVFCLKKKKERNELKHLDRHITSHHQSVNTNSELIV